MLEKFRADEGNKEAFKEALENFPSSLKTIDPEKSGVAVSPEELELRDLCQKVENYINLHLGNTMLLEKNTEATKEEVERFIELLEEQADRFNSVASSLRETLE